MADKIGTDEYGEILIYQTDDGQTNIEVKIEDDTVWLTQQQMSELFQTSRTNVVEHGDIMACRRVTDSKVANIFEDRLADVWICQMEKYRDYDKFVKCSKCELKAWCRGCPAVANGTSGNFYGADPQCWKTRNEITGEVLSC